MAWIESHTVLLRHRKIIQVSADLSIPPVHLIGHLHALWHAVLEQQEDGDLTDWPNVMIAQAASYPGDADLFVCTLQARNLLDGKIVHDWLDYAGRYLTGKYRTSNPRKLKQIYTLHKTVYKSASSQSKVRLKTDNLPNPPNLTKPDLRSMPLRAADGGLWLEELKKNPAYQHINFAVELGKMDAWLALRPKRKRTKTFVLNWLNKIDPPLVLPPRKERLPL